MRKKMATYEDFGEQDWTKYDMEIHEHLIVNGSTGKMFNRLDHNQNENYEKTNKIMETIGFEPILSACKTNTLPIKIYSLL